MTLRASAAREIPASPQQVLEFVLDLDRYSQVDTKVGRVVNPVVVDEHGRGSTKYWGRMRGTPPMPDKNVVALDRWTSLVFTSAPRQPGRLIVNFSGRFDCEPSPAGCRLMHSYEVQFRRPFRWIYEPLLATWLQEELDAEVDRFVEVFSE